MRMALGLRWERAAALFAAILVTMVVALTVVGALPAQAGENGKKDTAVVLEDVSLTYDGGTFTTESSSFFRMGNSWG